MEVQVPPEARALFREEPGSFVEARDALAGRLREEGRTGDAATVKALRKPTVPAWALNQLSADNPDEVTALLETGAELRAAQLAAMSSPGDLDRLRIATAERQEAIARLSRAATAFLAEHDRPPMSHLDVIAAALETASVDPEAGARLSEGTFERPPPRMAGFGDVAAMTVLSGGGDPQATEAAAAERLDRDSLRRDRDAAVGRARKERQAADAFAQELEAMQARMDTLRSKHTQAESRAEAAELEAKRAERALQRSKDR